MVHVIRTWNELWGQGQGHTRLKINLEAWHRFLGCFRFSSFIIIIVIIHYSVVRCTFLVGFSVLHFAFYRVYWASFDVTAQTQWRQMSPLICLVSCSSPVSWRCIGMLADKQASIVVRWHGNGWWRWWTTCLCRVSITRWIRRHRSAARPRSLALVVVLPSIVS